MELVPEVLGVDKSPLLCNRQNSESEMKPQIWSSLKIKEVSEMWSTNSTLIWLIAQEGIVVCSHSENFKSWIYYI